MRSGRGKHQCMRKQLWSEVGIVIKSLASLIAMSGAFSLFFLPSPHAATPTYLDPGTGSMILQVLIGFLVGGLLMLKIFWGRISTWVKNLFSREEKLEEQEKPKR